MSATTQLRHCQLLLLGPIVNVAVKIFVKCHSPETKTNIAKAIKRGEKWQGIKFASSAYPMPYAERRCFNALTVVPEHCPATGLYEKENTSTMCMK